METLAARLQALMRSHGIRSQSQLARRAQVPQSTVNRILKRPGYAPSWVTLSRLAESLGVSVAWLAEGKGTPVVQEAAAEYAAAPQAGAAVVGDARLREALSILERLDDDDRGKVLDVLRLIDHRGRSVTE